MFWLIVLFSQLICVSFFITTYLALNFLSDVGYYVGQPHVFLTTIDVKTLGKLQSPSVYFPFTIRNV